MRLVVSQLGTVDYASATALQEQLVERRMAGGDDRLLLLDHPAVYTLGRGADPRFLGLAAEGPIPIVRSSRGGQVTYHGPGQLVGYPILDLRAHRCDVRWYVRQLEAVLIDTLAQVGLAGERRAGAPGVWVRGAEIASIGVAIRRWVTWHGVALNVEADLSAFERITPCGLDGVRMTSLAREGVMAAVSETAVLLRDAFVRVFGYPAWVESDPPRPEHEVRA
jgi:lipoyl(octanoyl) transferase